MIELAWRKVGGSNNMRSLKEKGEGGQWHYCILYTGAPGSAGSEFILNSSKDCAQEKSTLVEQSISKGIPFIGNLCKQNLYFQSI